MAETFTPLPEGDYLKNPGYLKLDLMLRGVRVDTAFYEAGLVRREHRRSARLYGNLDLILPHDTYVSVPYQEAHVAQSPYALSLVGKKVELASDHGRIPVELIPQSSFYEELIRPGVTINQVLQCHGGYVSLALGGHRYLKAHILDDPKLDFDEKLALTRDQVITVLETVQRHHPIDVVSLSSWKTDTDDGGIAQIEGYIKTIKKSFNTLVFIEIHLPKTKEWIDHTYAIGADSVCYHLGGLCHHGEGGGHATVGIHSEQTIPFLEHAVRVFPRGSTLCHITMGDRPIADVIEDIETLTQLKVLPVLTLTSLQQALDKGLTAADLAPLFGYVYNASKKHRIPMTWFSKLAPFVAPIEGRFFSGDQPRFRLALLNFYQSRLFGGSISANLANLRRRLRVKEVSK